MRYHWAFRHDFPEMPVKTNKGAPIFIGCLDSSYLDALGNLVTNVQAKFCPWPCAKMIVGFSMGGLGSWQLAAKLPTFFDVIVAAASYCPY